MAENGVTPHKFIYKMLRNAADSIDMNVNGSVTAQIFYFEAPKGCRLWRINFTLLDASVNPADFGGITSGLTNGCILRIVNQEGGLKLDYTDGVPIKQNADWALLAGVDSTITDAVGDDQLPIRFTFQRAGNVPHLDQLDRIEFVIQDDLTALTKFRAMVQGLKD